MDNLLTAILIFYAIAVTIMLGIAIYLIHRADADNKYISDRRDTYYDRYVDTLRELKSYQDDYVALKKELKESQSFSNNHHTVEIVRTVRKMDWANGTVDIPYSLFEDDDLSEDEMNKVEKAVEFAMYDMFKHHVLPTMCFEVSIDSNRLTEQFKFAIPCLETKESAINLESKHPIVDKIRELDAAKRGKWMI